jgi:DNA-binding NarL/FixJ family response regulator
MSTHNNLRSVFCLEHGADLWSRLEEALAGQTSYVLGRCRPDSDLVKLCRRLTPALLITEEAIAHQLPFDELRDLISARDLYMLVIVEREDPAICEDFLRKGCAGVLEKRASVQTFRRAIDALFAGELWLSRKILSRLLHHALFHNAARTLTRREAEILKFICVGFNNQQIADQLFISRETVRWHVRSLYSKIGVSNRQGAIRYALERQDVPSSGKTH